MTILEAMRESMTAPLPAGLLGARTPPPTSLCVPVCGSRFHSPVFPRPIRPVCRLARSRNAAITYRRFHARDPP